MVFNLNRSNSQERIQQVRSFLTFIKSQESSTIPPSDEDIVKTMRGLFFVHLYAAFEKSINDAVEEYLLHVNSLRVKYRDFVHSFLPTALDPKFTSLQAGDRWQSRVEFSRLLDSNDVCSISSSVFAMHLQNTKAKSIDEIVRNIGCESIYERNDSDMHYLDEVADKRNQVAHGRNTPVAIGSSGRSNDLEIRIEALSRILDGFITMLEKSLNLRDFIQQDRRDDY